MPMFIPVIAIAAAYAATLITIEAAIIMAVISIATTLLTQMLAPKPKSPTAAATDLSNQQRTSQVRQPITPWAIVYGETAKSGPITFIESTQNNTYLHLVITLCSHPITEISTVYFNEIPIYTDQINSSGEVTSGQYAGFARIQRNLGTTGAQPFPSLVAESAGKWTDAHRQEGMAKLYVRLKFDRDVYQSIPSIRVHMKGKKVYDPRTATTKYSTNPVLIARDYLVTPTSEGGMGTSDAEFSDSNLIAAANVCEEFVDVVAGDNNGIFLADSSSDALELTGANGDLLKFQTGDRVVVTTTGTLPGGISAATNYYCIVVREAMWEIGGNSRRKSIRLATSFTNAMAGTYMDITSAGTGSHTVTKNGEPRYTAGGIITTDATPIQILEDLRSSMAGRIIPVGGQWLFLPGQYITPTLSFDEDDFAGPISTSTRHGRRERFNAVKGIYVTPFNKDQPTNYPPVISTIFEAADGGRRIFRDIDLPFTTRSNTAQRIAKIELYRHRREITAEVHLNLTGMQVQAGDFIQITNTKLGWSSKVFEVGLWELNVNDDQALIVKLGLREVDEDIFAFDPSVEEQPVSPAIRTNLPTVGKPTALSGLVLDSGSAQLFVRTDGTVITRLRADWTAPTDQFVLSGGRIEVQFKKTADTEWSSNGSAPGDTTFTHIIDVLDGVSYDVRIRAVSHLGFRSEWTVEAGHMVIGKTAPPTNVDSFTIEAAADGTRVFRWAHVLVDPDVRAGGGYKIRYAPFLGENDFDAMTELHEGVLTLSPFETNELAAGDYTFAIKAVDSSGNFSTAAVFIDATLPDPRLGNALLRSNEKQAGWPGEKIDCFVTADNDLLAIGSTTGTIDNLPATVNSLAATIIGMRPAKSPIRYTTLEYDLTSVVTFRPIITVLGVGTITTSMSVSDSTGSTTFTAVDTASGRYLKLRVNCAGSAPELNTLTILVDAPSVTETFEDVNTGSTSNPFWFIPSTEPGHFGIQTKGGISSIIQASITAIQNVGPGYTWDLISKNSTMSTAGPTAEFKIYDINSSQADAVVDILLRGPRAGVTSAASTVGSTASLLRITEDGSTRVTEEGDERSLESTK